MDTSVLSRWSLLGGGVTGPVPFGPPTATALAVYDGDSNWCGLVDRVRTFFATAPDTIQWPKFCVQAE